MSSLVCAQSLCRVEIFSRVRSGTAERKKSHNRYDLGGMDDMTKKKNVIPKKDAVKVPILGSSESAE